MRGERRDGKRTVTIPGSNGENRYGQLSEDIMKLADLTVALKKYATISDLMHDALR